METGATNEAKGETVDTNVVITLLTITVVLLSLVIVALLAIATVVLVKINRVLRSIEAITQNIASASDWLSPVKMFHHISKLFR
jgi:hypothetical protein